MFRGHMGVYLAPIVAYLTGACWLIDALIVLIQLRHSVESVVRCEH
jgi:hypothetical protein